MGWMRHINTLKMMDTLMKRESPGMKGTMMTPKRYRKLLRLLMVYIEGADPVGRKEGTSRIVVGLLSIRRLGRER